MALRPSSSAQNDISKTTMPGRRHAASAASMIGPEVVRTPCSSGAIHSIPLVEDPSASISSIPADSLTRSATFCIDLAFLDCFTEMDRMLIGFAA
jgi:hypothetical protein